MGATGYTFYVTTLEHRHSVTTFLFSSVVPPLGASASTALLLPIVGP
jgi:hypothetical protein